MGIARTVLVFTCLTACARPVSEHKALRPSAMPQVRQPHALASSVSPAVPRKPENGAPSQAPPTAAAAHLSGAYFGCGEPLPIGHLWDETEESEVLDAIDAAKICAAEHGRRLLLEFVAPWCEDCQEMARLDEAASVAATLKARFERVRVNVGKWDRHEALRQRFGVRALATYIIIDPKTSQELAKTTLEPITKRGQRLSPAAWAQWLQTH